MTRRISPLVAAACAAALILAAAFARPARAQAQSSAADQAVYTYVAEWAVPRTDWPQIEKFYKDAVPTLNKLVADGTIVGWGNARNWIHEDGGFTHESWVTATSFAGIQKALAAVRDAIPQPAAFAASKHADELLRSPLYGRKPGASGSGMLWVAHYRVREGQMDEFAQLFEAQIKPLFDQQLAAGTILAYSIDFQAVHTTQPGDVAIAYLMPDAAAIDKFQSALAAYQTKNPEIGPAMEATMDYGSHRDMIYEVMNFGQK